MELLDVVLDHRAADLEPLRAVFVLEIPLLTFFVISVCVTTRNHHEA